MNIEDKYINNKPNLNNALNLLIKSKDSIKHNYNKKYDEELNNILDLLSKAEYTLNKIVETED